MQHLGIEQYAHDHPQLDDLSASELPLTLRAALRGAPSARDVLDVGCGEGRLLAALARGTDARLVGVDLSATPR